MLLLYKSSCQAQFFLVFSLLPLFFFFLEPTSGSYFPFFTPRQSKRARHSELTLVTSAFPWLGICLMELIHISEGLHLCSLFWLYRHTAQPQQGDTETTPPQPPPSAVSPPKKQHRATKKAFTTCCGGTCYQHNPDQHSWEWFILFHCSTQNSKCATSKDGTKIASS